MNRKQKIIVSVTGIFIVLLILVGLTYGYYLTRILGNTNTKSIDITTAYLALKYDDGNGLITSEKIEPGTTIETKTFTVTNVGNNTVGNYVIALENVINELTNKDDLVYTLKCTSNNDKSPCNGVTDEVYPKINQVLVYNSIAVKTTHTYELTITYKETGLNQSDDMGKNIEGKIEIYDARNIVDIDGTVTNASDGDYVELHSEVKKSSIDNNSKYKIVGVFPGTHTIYVKDKEGNIKASREIVIEKSNNIDVDLDKITINENVSNINMDLNIKNGELEIDVEVVENPYKENANSLNYNILNNAIKTKNGTSLSKTPITNPGTEISKVYTYKDTYEEFGIYSISIGADKQDYYVTYAEEFEFDKSTGKFNLVNPKTCKYSECYSELVGKYVPSNHYLHFAKANDALSTSKNLTRVYKIYKAPTPDSTKAIYLGITVYKNIPDAAERTISVTSDNDGNSYYYRGDIKDNYVNFADMCWRIVRVAGDGTTKLVLEDKNTTCNSENYTGNYQYATVPFGYKLETLSDGTKVYKNDFLNYENGLYDKLKEFQTSKMNNYLDYLSKGKWCYDNRAYSDEAGTNEISNSDLETYYQNKTPFYYAPYVRLVKKQTPTLKCSGTELNKYRDNTDMYVGALTADEVTFAGTKYGETSFDNYLMNTLALLYNWNWTLSPFANMNVNSDNYINIFSLTGTGSLQGLNNTYSYTVRPTINLKPGIEINSGDGTISNPYVIS